MQTMDLKSANFYKIAELFPNCIVESQDDDWNSISKIDFDLLRAELSWISTGWLEERYRLDWPGKWRSILKANTPITKTVRPVKEDSVNWESTWNLYIEWDNFEVLKILQESYLWRIKCIYIDPPYNTGNDFVYNDDFTEDSSEYKEKTERNENGYIMVRNTESNGRFHSDWLSMMYERLKVARDLLSDDWVIFISIGDDEVANLEKICDEIFGQNAKLWVIVQEKWNAQNDALNIQNNHDYIVVYQKSSLYDWTKEQSTIYENIEDEIELIKEWERYYYIWSGITTWWEWWTLNHRPNLWYTIYYNPETDDRIAVDDYDKEKAKTSNNEDDIYTDDKTLLSKWYEIIRAPKKWNLLWVWTWWLEKFNNEKDNILIKKSPKWYSVRKKEYITNTDDIYEKWGKYYLNMSKRKNIRSIWSFNSASWTSTLNWILWNRIFDNPKNLDMLKYIISISNLEDNDIVLDFFSWSATTAQACMELNAEDWVDRKFIMVQLPEVCEEWSAAYNAWYRNICEIWKERIRKSAELIKKKSSFDIDYGFRVYRVDESCMKDVYYHPEKIDQNLLIKDISNIKEDRSPEDILTQVILNLWLTLDLPIEEKTVWKNRIFYVAWNSLIACFDPNVDSSVMEEVAKDQPIKMVFCDSCFKNDEDRINVENKVRRISPETTVKVI